MSVLFMGWPMTGLGLLRREHRFRTLSMSSVGTYVIGYLVVGVGLALLGAAGSPDAAEQAGRAAWGIPPPLGGDGRHRLRTPTWSSRLAEPAGRSATSTGPYP